MKIKEDKEIKIPRIMFYTIYANFMFVLIMGIFFLNWLLYVGDIGHLRLIPLGLTTFGIVAFYVIMLGSVGEGFTKNSPQNHFQDLKRATVYFFLLFGVFTAIFQYDKHNKPLPIKEVLVAEKVIKITDLEIYDIHKKNIKYAISYKDIEGKVRWQNIFDTDADRLTYLNTIIKEGKFIVEINLKIDKHNKVSLEIIKQKIKG